MPILFPLVGSRLHGTSGAVPLRGMLAPDQGTPRFIASPLIVRASRVAVAVGFGLFIGHAPARALGPAVRPLMVSSVSVTRAAIQPIIGRHPLVGAVAPPAVRAHIAPLIVSAPRAQPRIAPIVVGKPVVLHAVAVLAVRSVRPLVVALATSRIVIVRPQVWRHVLPVAVPAPISTYQPGGGGRRVNLGRRYRNFTRAERDELRAMFRRPHPHDLSRNIAQAVVAPTPVPHVTPPAAPVVARSPALDAFIADLIANRFPALATTDALRGLPTAVESAAVVAPGTPPSAQTTAPTPEPHWITDEMMDALIYALAEV